MSAYAKFLESLLDTVLPATPVGALLVSSDYEPAVTDQYVADISSHEISGSGYLRVAPTSVAVNLDTDTGEISVVCDDVTFAGLTAEIDDVGGIVFFLDTGDDTTAQLLSSDIEGPFNVPAGDLVYSADPSGFLSIAT